VDKSRRSIAVLSIFLLFVFFPVIPSIAQKKSKDPLAGLSPAEDAGLRLVALEFKGHIKLAIGDPFPVMLVEPITWRSMTHHQKINLGELALKYVNGLKKEQNLKYEFVFINDMTTKERLGTVYLNENRVEVFK